MQILVSVLPIPELFPGAVINEMLRQVYSLSPHFVHFILQGNKWHSNSLGKYYRKWLCPRQFLICYNFQDKVFTYNFEVSRGFNLLKLIQAQRLVERDYYSKMIVIIMLERPLALHSIHHKSSIFLFHQNRNIWSFFHSLVGVVIT